ncbi:MAG TPA: CcmD family protein [Gemmatimonadaceae bacterium]|jgi:CcmD family protein|nr:CcmD family protein [Gemmatimonadaceae bacterium]
MDSNTKFIVAAFTITWAVLLAYAWRLARVRGEAERRLRHAKAEYPGEES